MRRAWVALLAMVSMGTVASSVKGQAVAPTPATGAPPAAAAPAASAPPAAAASATSSDVSGPDTKYQLALRVGFSLPVGDISGEFGGAMPFWLDLGYRISPKIVIGVYAQYGVLFITDCPANSCQGYDLHFGGEVHYHFAPFKDFDPWAGVGAGYELAGTVGNGGGSIGGIEFANLQGGLDFKPGFGPFAGLSIDQFSQSGQSSMHQWFTLGVRGIYDW